MPYSSAGVQGLIQQASLDRRLFGSMAALLAARAPLGALLLAAMGPFGVISGSVTRRAPAQIACVASQYTRANRSKSLFVAKLLEPVVDDVNGQRLFIHDPVGQDDAFAVGGDVILRIEGC